MMRTVVLHTDNNRITRFPNGLSVDGVLQPLGQLSPNVWHLEELDIKPIPGENQYLEKMSPYTDFDNNKWVIEYILKDVVLPEPEIPRLTPRQLRLGLLNAKGITPNVIENMLGDNTAALIEWNFATYTERTHPMVAMLGGALNMTEEDIDNFFFYASTL